MIELAANIFSYPVNSLAQMLNSNFVTSLVGAGAGAWAGAYAAQKIAARANERSELLNEIRNAIGGFNLAVMIFNVCLGLKKQHIKNLKDIYDKKKAEFSDVIRRRDAGEGGLAYELRADFESLTPIVVPVDQLQTIVLEKITNKRRAAIFASMLSQTIHSLNEALTIRNRLIDDFRAAGAHSQAQLLQFYFGVPDQRGMVDNRYGGTVEAIYRYADDCIFLSKSIADDLSMHGKNLKVRFEKQFRGHAPFVGSLKVEKKEYREFLPDQKEYSSWDGLRSE